MYIILLISILQSILRNGRSEEWHGSRIGTKDYNKELDTVKGEYMHEAEVYVMKNSTRFLCATFVGNSSSALQILQRNIELSISACTWVVIEYNVLSQVCSNSFVKLHTIYCQKATLLNMYNNISIPKSVMYHDFVHLVRFYENVFLMDEDISLIGFDFQIFSKNWDCVFHPKPLIVQPLIAEYTQYILWANERPWRHRNFKRIIGNEVHLVEQQVPMFDSRFFHWFVTKVLKPLKTISAIYGADWGHDRTWCNAAKLYSTYILQKNETNVVCAVFPHATSVHHLNTRSFNMKKKDNRRFRENAKHVVQEYINLYPTLVITDIYPFCNPFDYRYGKSLKRVLNNNDAANTCLGAT